MCREPAPSLDLPHYPEEPIIDQRLPYGDSQYAHLTSSPRVGNHGCLGLITLFLILVVTGRAVDLSGVYVDGGTRIPGGPSQLPEQPSLRALLTHEFDSKAATVSHDQTSHVVVKHSGDELLIEVYDVEEKVSWSARWIEGREYSVQGERVIVRIPSAKVSGEELILVLERLPGHGLLQVNAQRLRPDRARTRRAQLGNSSVLHDALIESRGFNHPHDRFGINPRVTHQVDRAGQLAGPEANTPRLPRVPLPPWRVRAAGQSTPPFHIPLISV